MFLPGFAGELCSLLGEAYNVGLKTAPIIDGVVAFGEMFEPDIVWCVLQGQTMIRLALPVSTRLKVPLLTHVWDPPGWWMRAHHVNRWTRRKIITDYETTLRGSFRSFVASEAMANAYGNEFGVKVEYFMPSLARELRYPPAKSIHPSEKFVIAMAGQLYAIDEWNSLLIALDSCGWKIGERDVEISLVGSHSRVPLSTSQAERVKMHGWLSQEETIRVCSEADLLYCPYWFSVEFEEEARLSFPSKLTTYLAAGRPVFFHGPSYASPAKFLQRNDAAFLCHSLQIEDILESLTSATSDVKRYGLIASNGSKVFIENMTAESMEARFKKFLNLEEDL